MCIANRHNRIVYYPIGLCMSNQFTFASDAHGQHYCDIDLDDHSGIKHAIDFVEHKIFQEETHPYTIHELLVKYQRHGDPEYLLL